MIMLEKIGFFVFTILFVTARAEFDLTLNGSQYFSYSLLSRQRRGVDNDILLLFRTRKPSSLLLYMTGTTGDFIIVELVRGKLRYAANIGTVGESDESVFQEIVVGDNLGDNLWHQVEITRRRETTYVTVDVTSKKQQTSSSKLVTISLDKMVFIAGLNPLEWTNAGQRLLSKTNFSGCLSDIQIGRDNAGYEKLDVLKLTRTSPQLMKLQGKGQWHCDESDRFMPMNFPKKNSYLVSKKPSKDGLELQFSFRTYQQRGLVASNNGIKLSGNDTRFALFLKDNRIHLSINGKVLLTLQPSRAIDDGLWNKVYLLIEREKTIFKINKQKASYNLKDKVNLKFGHSVIFGSNRDQSPGFIGCLLDVIIDGAPIDVSKIAARGITLNQCRMADHCFPNPCKNFGKCVQYGNKTTCDCTKTEYTGKLCDKQEYEFKKSCFEYFHAGFRRSGLYKIKPNTLPAFVVKCNMTNPLGPSTIIEHDHQNPVTVGTQEDVASRFYHHPLRYKVDLIRVEGLIKQSALCRQFIRYNCYSSTLMYSSNRYISEKNAFGARWYSRNGVIRNYWGGASPSSFKCSCGMAKKCVQKRLACNCDKMDKVWRSDDGYLTNKLDLPITRLQFSKLKTNSVSFFEVGPLECFGKVGSRTVKPTTIKKASGKPESTPSVSYVPKTTPIQTTSKLKDSTSSTISTPTTTRYPLSTQDRSMTSPLPISGNGVGISSTIFPNISLHSSESMTSTDTDKMTVIKTESPTVKEGSKQIIVINQPTKSGGRVLSDQMLLLTVLTSVLILIAVAVILVLLRQRLLCCLVERRARVTKKLDAEVSVHEEGCSGNNNFSDHLDPGLGCPSGVTVDLEDLDKIGIMIPLRYQSTSSIASSIVADTSRYLDVDGESDSASISSVRSRDPINNLPKRGILKGKNSLLHNVRQKCHSDDIYLLKQSTAEEADSETLSVFRKTTDDSRSVDQVNTEYDFADLGSDSSVSSVRKNSPIYKQWKTRHSSTESVEKPTLDADIEINDGSSSSSHSCRSLGSSVSDDSNEETEDRTSRKNRRLERNLKRSVRFSLHEGYLEYEPCDKASILRKATMNLDFHTPDGLQSQ